MIKQNIQGIHFLSINTKISFKLEKASKITMPFIYILSKTLEIGEEAYIKSIMTMKAKKL